MGELTVPPTVPASPASTGPAWIWDAFHRETPNQLLLFRRHVAMVGGAVSGSLEIAARGAFRFWVDGRFVTHHDVQSAFPGADAIRVDLESVFAARTAPPGRGTVTARDIDSAPLGGSPDAGCTIVVAAHLVGVGTHHQQRASGGLWVRGTLIDAFGTEHTVDSGARWECTVPPWWRQTTPQTVWSTGYAERSDRTAGDETLVAGLGDGWSAAVTYPDPETPTPFDREVREIPGSLLPFRTESGSISSVAWESSWTTRADAAVVLGQARVPEPAAASGGTSTMPTDATVAGGSPIPRPAVPGVAGTVAAVARTGRYDVFALPHEQVGFLTLDLDCTTAATVDVLYGEALDEHGWPTATRQGIAAVDTISVRPGRTVHRFWNRRAFRYLAVLTRGAATLHAATLHAVTAPRPAPVFATSSARYRRMHEVSVATAAVGRQDLYEDCPLREGGHYTADARLQAMFDLATTGVATTARRSVLQFTDAQDPDGMLPALWPSGTRHRIPDFALQWPAYVDDVVRFTDDAVLLAEAWPALLRVMEWAHDRAPSGTFDLDEPGWWPFIDWAEFSPDALRAAVDAQYAVALRSAIDLARRAGDEARADLYGARLDSVLEVLTAAGPVRQPHAATILLCGLDAEVAREVVAPDALDDFAPDTGYFMFSVCRAQIVLGHPDRARTLLDRYWGGMLDAGAGTWWERYSPARNVTADVSLCHPWSAGPLVLLPMLALGVDPFARSEQTSRFPAQDLGVTAALHTPWGLVSV